MSTAHSVPAPPVSAPPRRSWGRWLLLVGVLAAGALGVGLVYLLDPWLRTQLEQQVAQSSRGRYQLRVADLRTSLWERRLHLRGLELRTVGPTPPDSGRLPRVALSLNRVDVTGVGLLALLRRQQVPIARVTLDSLTFHLAALPTGGSSQPLHQGLPVAGLRIGLVELRQVRASVGPSARPYLRVGPSALALQDVWVSAAGAADSARVGYAAALALRVGGAVAQVPGHTLHVVRAAFASTTRRLRLDSVVVRPRQAVSATRSAAARVQLTLPRLELTGLDAARLARRHFRADTLRLTRPRLACTLPAQAPPSLHELLSPYLREFRLEGLAVTGGQLRVAGVEQAPVVADIQATARQIHVLPHRPAAASVYYAQQWQVSTGVTSVRLDGPYYHLSWQHLRADTKTGRLQLGQVLVLPTMSVAELARRKGHQAAHVMSRLARVQLTGLDYAAAANRRQLRAAALVVSGAQVSTRSDGRFARNPNLSLVTPEALGKVPFRFDLRRLRIEPTTITMTYRAPRDPQPGVLSINRFAGTLRNLTNDPRRMSAATPLTGEAVGWLQNRCPARVVLRANLLDARGRHQFSGTLGPAPLHILHPMLVPTQGLRFRSGQVQRIRFAMTLDQTAARGTMWGQYTDLKLQLLNQQEKPGVLPRLGTSLVNGLFIRDNNPRRPGQALRPGSMSSSRDRRYSVFSLWRQGLVSGMLNSAGVPSALAQKISEQE